MQYSYKDFEHLRNDYMRQAERSRIVAMAKNSRVRGAGARVPFYGPLLAHIGVLLTGLGVYLQRRYSVARDLCAEDLKLKKKPRTLSA